MRLRTIKFLLVFLCLTAVTALTGQVIDIPENQLAEMTDTVRATENVIKHLQGTPAAIISDEGKITMTRDQAITFLENVTSSGTIWKRSNDSLRQGLRKLVFFARELPEDSTVSYLTDYDYDLLRINSGSSGTNDSAQVILPVPPRPDTSATADGRQPDRATDTLTGVTLYNDDFPSGGISNPYVADSIEAAVRSLAEYLRERDSTRIKLIAETGRGTELWLNGRSDNLVRFWLPGGEYDSLSVWVGSPAHNTLSLKAEKGVMFGKQLWDDSHIDTRVDVTTAEAEELRKVELSRVRPDYWKFRTDMSYLLSQGIISNWAKGGENSVSTLLDVTSAIDYSNKDTKVNSSTTARFSLGLQASGKEAAIKKNADLLEINSKINHKAFGKFDLSGLFQFKTQVLPGYNYPNDSVKVSKFFNPATFLFGYGLEYKPDKNTSISFSPLSYKGTFVPDTSINQTKFGIPAGKRSKNELGAYLTINSKMTLFEKVTMTNRIQLFSNFLSDPQNVDVDWEMIATTSLNWFTDVRLNIHLIYDDNTLLPVYEDGEPVLGLDGEQKKAPMLQFKELLGVSFIFKF